MFTKPIDEITFEDVESFCNEWTEGVRVEYKSEITVNRHVPKIVSSFANTHGGIFLIGVEADQKNNRVNAIPGIPQQNGIEEQIQQSALTGIYPGVIPEIKLVPVPNTGNVVVVVSVDESVQAPHAIQNSTRVYIRTGSITNPYDLADIDRLTYMLKRRDNSQVVFQQILNRIEKRIGNVQPILISEPTLTIIACPVFPYHPVISVSEIHKLCEAAVLFPLRRVVGGVFSVHPTEYLEFNEYGMVYYRIALSIYNQRKLNYSDFILYIRSLIDNSKTLYKKCEYMGNIEISAQLLGVLDKELGDPGSHAYGGSKITDGSIPGDPKCSDSTVLASKHCLARDLENAEKQNDIIEELTSQLLWAFNIPIDKPWIRKRVRRRIEHGL